MMGEREKEPVTHNDWEGWEANSYGCWKLALEWCAEKKAKGEFVKYGNRKEG